MDPRSILAIPAALANISGIRGFIKQLLVLMTILFADALTRSLIQAFTNVSSEKEVDGLTVYDTPAPDLWSRAMGSIVFLTKAATTYHLGRLSDRLGRRPILLLGTLGLGLSTLMLGATSNTWIQNSARTIQGVCTGNLETTKTVMAEIANDANRHLVYATIPLMQSVGVNFGTSLGSFLSKLSESVSFIQSHPLVIPCMIAGTFCFISFHMTYKHFKETLPSDILLDWKVVFKLKKTIEASVADVSSNLLEHANEIHYGATSVIQKTIEEGVAPITKVVESSSTPVKHVEGVLPNVVAETSSQPLKRVEGVVTGVSATDSSSTLGENVKDASPSGNVVDTPSSFLERARDISSKVTVVETSLALVEQAMGAVPNSNAAKAPSSLPEHVEVASSDNDATRDLVDPSKPAEAVVPSIDLGKASSSIFKHAEGFLSNAAKASSNATDRVQDMSPISGILKAPSIVPKRAEDASSDDNATNTSHTVPQHVNDAHGTTVIQETIEKSISSNISIVGASSNLLNHIENIPSNDNVTEASSQLPKHLDAVSPKTSIVETSSTLLEHVSQIPSGNIPTMPKILEEGISVVSQRVEQQLTSVIPLNQIRDVLHMKDMITPTFVRALVNYSVVSFLNQSREVLLPAVYTSPVGSYGLGLSPEELAKIIAKSGTYNVGVQAILFPWLVHRWGPRKLYSKCLFSMAIFFACFPLMLITVRILNGAETLLRGMIYIQMAVYSFTFMADGCIQMLMMEAAPNKNSLGTVNGMAQSIGSSSRMVAQLVISFGLAPTIAKQFFSDYFVYLFALVMIILGVVTPSLL